MVIPDNSHIMNGIINRYNRDMMIINGMTTNTYENWKDKEHYFNKQREILLDTTIKELDSMENPIEKILCYAKYKKDEKGGYGREADKHLLHTWMSQLLTGDLKEEPFKWEFVGNDYRYVYGAVTVSLDLSVMRVILKNEVRMPYCDDVNLNRNSNPCRESLLLSLQSYSNKALKIPSRELYNKCIEWVKMEPSYKHTFHPTTNRRQFWDYKMQFLKILLIPTKLKRFIDRLETQDKIVIEERELIDKISKEKNEVIELNQNLVRKNNLLNAVNELKKYQEFEIHTPDWFPEK